MKDVLLSTFLLTIVYAATDDGGNVCNYPLTGQEVSQSAVPINNFRTSGNDFVRPTWCITYCNDRKSVKAAMNFQLANSSSPVYSIQSRRLSNGKAEINRKLIKGEKLDDDDDNFCIDDHVSNTVDLVFNKYDDLETISEALNYYINKEGWAFLVYQLGPPPTMVSTDNAQQDPNFCMKTVGKPINNTIIYYEMYGGLVKN